MDNHSWKMILDGRQLLTFDSRLALMEDNLKGRTHFLEGGMGRHKKNGLFNAIDHISSHPPPPKDDIRQK